jgi:hypothetical protein
MFPHGGRELVFAHATLASDTVERRVVCPQRGGGRLLLLLLLLVGM